MLRVLDGVIALPVTRDLIRRVARAHVEQGMCIPRPAHFGCVDDQHAYERCFHEQARQRDMEQAECA